MWAVEPSCMGGWCLERELCAHHVRPAGRPVERLCAPGDDDRFEPAPGLVPTWPADPINTDPLSAVYLVNKR